ncbi:MAG: hypothetical protein IJL41_04580 [Clostridia bacterium]|nr:hypothetical protein [Clostridia bacterium]
MRRFKDGGFTRRDTAYCALSRTLDLRTGTPRSVRDEFGELFAAETDTECVFLRTARDFPQQCGNDARDVSKT